MRNDDVILSDAYIGVEKDWYADQYEKHIGKPLPRKQLSTNEVLKRLKDSTRYRWIPEAKTYERSKPIAGTVHYLEWKGPTIKKCTCPNNDCTCKGDIMFPRKRIPRGQKYFHSTLTYKWIRRFKKPDPPPKLNFVQRLATVLDVEAAHYKDLEKKGICWC